MGPGGYRFGDYWRLGLPLSLIVAVFGVDPRSRSSGRSAANDQSEAVASHGMPGGSPPGMPCEATASL